MKELKSITSLLPCISILFFLMTVVIYTNWVVAEDGIVMTDLPAISEFELYLSALEKAVNYCFKNKKSVDLNLQFGLFMIDVNLRQVLEQEVTNIPAQTHSRLKKVFRKYDVVAEYYQSMVKKNLNVTNYEQHQKLALLFYQANTWLRLDTFNLNLLQDTLIYTPEKRKEVFGNSEDYLMSVYDFEKMQPTPAEIDSCLAMLALTNTKDNKKTTAPLTCQIPNRCKQVMLNGNHSGYGLTHRILFMAVARFSRRCTVFSKIKDKIVVNEFCKKCFNEALFIATNNILLHDLMYEQMVVCGLFGHAQFMTKTWLRRRLGYQIENGCFSEMKTIRDFGENQMREDENDEWKIERSLDNTNGQCNGHFTAMALAVLSSALRFIIENYYVDF